MCHYMEPLLTDALDRKPRTFPLPAAAQPDAPPQIDEQKKSRTKVRLPTPEALADVALIDVTTAAAGGGMGRSWWHAEVAAQRAPQPVIREPRCTRWRLVDVIRFWRERAEQGPANASTAEALKARATKASRAAQVKRTAVAKARS